MAFVLVAASGMVSAYASGSSGTKKAKVQTITEGVCIGSVDVGGMTKEEAKKAVDAYVDSIKDTAFSLKGANGSFDATAQEMSVSADTDAAVDEALSVCHEGSLIDRFVESEELKKGNVAVNMYLSVDKQKTANMIYDKSDELNIKAVNNSLQRNGDSFDFVPGQEGKEVDVVKSVYAINDFLQNSWDGSANEIELVTNTVQPRGSKEELSKIKDNLGGFSTDFSSSAAGRAANVKNACSLINGSVIYPGEQFSVYEAISPITTDNGYQIAGAYENGQVVDSVGGGVCQVATTLYNAVIRAELEIVQRYNHSMIVNYVKPSDDAAIAGTYKDLKFKNNLDNPVYIEGYCSGGVITFNVYGVETRPANREISFRSETISEEDPVTQFKFDAGQPVGYFHTEQSAHKGLTARLWKTVTVDGAVQSDEVFNNSKYKSSPKIVTVGTAGASAEVVAQLQAAAAANDEGSVKSIAASAAAAVQAAQTQTQDPNAAGQTQGAQTQTTDPNAAGQTQGTQPQPTDQNAAGQAQGTQTQPTDQNAAGQAQGTQTQQPAGQTQGAQTQ